MPRSYSKLSILYIAVALVTQLPALRAQNALSIWHTTLQASSGQTIPAFTLGPWLVSCTLVAPASGACGSQQLECSPVHATTGIPASVALLPALQAGYLQQAQSPLVSSTGTDKHVLRASTCDGSGEEVRVVISLTGSVAVPLAMHSTVLPQASSVFTVPSGACSEWVTMQCGSDIVHTALQLSAAGNHVETATWATGSQQPMFADMDVPRNFSAASVQPVRADTAMFALGNATSLDGLQSIQLVDACTLANPMPLVHRVPITFELSAIQLDAVSTALLMPAANGPELHVCSADLAASAEVSAACWNVTLPNAGSTAVTMAFEPFAIGGQLMPVSYYELDTQSGFTGDAHIVLNLTAQGVHMGAAAPLPGKVLPSADRSLCQGASVVALPSRCHITVDRSQVLQVPQQAAQIIRESVTAGGELEALGILPCTGNLAAGLLQTQPAVYTVCTSGSTPGVYALAFPSGQVSPSPVATPSPLASSSPQPENPISSASPPRWAYNDSFLGLSFQLQEWMLHCNTNTSESGCVVRAMMCTPLKLATGQAAPAITWSHGVPAFDQLFAVMQGNSADKLVLSTGTCQGQSLTAEVTIDASTGQPKLAKTSTLQHPLPTDLSAVDVDSISIFVTAEVTCGQQTVLPVCTLWQYSNSTLAVAVSHAAGSFVTAMPFSGQARLHSFNSEAWPGFSSTVLSVVARDQAQFSTGVVLFMDLCSGKQAAQPASGASFVRNMLPLTDGMAGYMLTNQQSTMRWCQMGHGQQQHTCSALQLPRLPVNVTFLSTRYVHVVNGNTLALSQVLFDIFGAVEASYHVTYTITAQGLTERTGWQQRILTSSGEACMPTWSTTVPPAGCVQLLIEPGRVDQQGAAVLGYERTDYLNGWHGPATYAVYSSPQLTEVFMLNDEAIVVTDDGQGLVRAYSMAPWSASPAPSTPANSSSNQGAQASESDSAGLYIGIGIGAVVCVAVAGLIGYKSVQRRQAAQPRSKFEASATGAMDEEAGITLRENPLHNAKPPVHA